LGGGGCGVVVWSVGNDCRDAIVRDFARAAEGVICHRADEGRLLDVGRAINAIVGKSGVLLTRLGIRKGDPGLSGC